MIEALFLLISIMIVMVATVIVVNYIRLRDDRIIEVEQRKKKNDRR